jgi:hypothetical protein
MRAHASAAAFAVIIACAASARADDPRAEQLYLEGKQLASQGNYAEACPKLEASQKIEAAIGTQYNLADCYEHTHRPATALGLYREVARIAQMSAKHDRQHAAEERIAQLEKTAPRLVIVKPASPPADLRIERDGVPVSDAEANAGVIVDPGDHLVRAAAPKYLAWETHVRVDENVPPVVVTMPSLQPEPTPPPDRTTPPPPSGLPPLRIAAIAVASAGLVGLVVGGVFGANAISKKNDAGCDGVDCRNATPTGAQSLHDAQTAATTSTVFFIVGGALVAGGVALWIFAPKPAASSAASVLPSAQAAVVLRGSALAVEGRW